MPNYAVVRVTNFDLADFAPYHQRYYRVDVGGTIYGARSRRKVDLAVLPTNIRNALFNNGFYEFSLGANMISRLSENPLTVRP